jgi:hypothetical protein
VGAHAEERTDVFAGSGYTREIGRSLVIATAVRSVSRASNRTRDGDQPRVVASEKELQ